MTGSAFLMRLGSIKSSMQGVLVTGIIVLLAACSDNPENPEIPGVEEARQKWHGMGYTDYSITEYRDCYCPLGGVPVRLLVRADSIVSGLNLDDSSAVDSDLLQWYKTVDEIFDEIETVDAANVSSFQVTFHKEFGYPEIFYVDPSAEIADEEHGYRLENLHPLR